ncbi:L-threonine O-3-phosphate decarboxylase [Sphingomonas palmae]|uniref:L-threonine O-3-phosphate decarboxylase n=1 Tax=Sphingomonas palmae TaxID=1855283 RepID=A0A1H7GN93_9SPHN|nr:aminotransferase class I/II-fold pyridoxal phosphate-dependent enzyme [Sphingomonas palmae]SEK39539.1 L-threonine O-3-phosphate decarboxylase [Sphingomonas palmae]
MAKAHAVTQAESPRFARHGGRLDDARSHYPDAPTPWLDLSTGINPRPWVPASFDFDSGPLPEMSSLRRLERAAAAFFGCAPEQVAAVPGSEVALRLLPFIGLPRPLVAASPTYGTHREVAEHAVSHAALAEQADSGGTLLLANPNNPDGLLRTHDELLALAARASAASGAVVIDEAFADVDPSISIVPHLRKAANVTVLRSFGKFFGLAGVRLGFVVGNATVIDRMRALLGDWPVSTQAIIWSTAGYSDAAWITKTRTWLRAQAARLDALLAAHGLQAGGACPLFRLVEHPGAWDIFDLLARAGILTRPFDAQPNWLRFGLPADDAAFDRLDRALARG